MKKASKGTTRALDRGLALLDALIRKQPQTLSELARSCNLAKSTAYRLLLTLKARGFVKEGADGRYRTGHRSIWLTGASLPIQRELDRLRARTGETANLGILSGREIEYVARAVSAHALRWGVDIGSRVPCYCTAMGKAVMAFRPDVVYRPEELEARTPRTITDPFELRAQLELVRLRGYAIDDEEIIQGVFCIAVPVRDESGEVIGALSVAGPSVRWDRSTAVKHVEAIKAAGEAVSRLLGHRPERGGTEDAATLGG